MLELEHNLEEEFGYLGIDMAEDNVEDLEKIEVCGYPASKSKTMWKDFGPIKKISNKFLRYGLSTEKGQSGSPIIKRKDDKEYIVGIHIGKMTIKPNLNIAVRLTPDKRRRINEWFGEIT